jgi:Putative prokaryotic signal transducing protein
VVEAIRSIFSWLGRGQRPGPAATTSETTSGGDHGIRWVPIGVNLNPGEAMVIKGRLTSEDIPAIVQQEAFGSFIGLTVWPMGSAQVLVPEALAERALSIVAETFDGLQAEDQVWEDEIEDDDRE